MKNGRRLILIVGCAALAAGNEALTVMTGSKAFTNKALISPGLARRITAQDLPKPQAQGWPKGSLMMIGAGASSPGKRPEGVAVAADGSLLVTVAAASVIWRVSETGK